MSNIRNIFILYTDRNYAVSFSLLLSFAIGSERQTNQVPSLCPSQTPNTLLHAHTCSQVDGVVLSRTPALDGCALDFFEFHPGGGKKSRDFEGSFSNDQHSYRKL